MALYEYTATGPTGLQVAQDKLLTENDLYFGRGKVEAANKEAALAAARVDLLSSLFNPADIDDILFEVRRWTPPTD